jgi:hypothetical protein
LLIGFGARGDTREMRCHYLGPFKPFVDSKATLRKGQNLESTLIRARVWRLALGVSGGGRNYFQVWRVCKGQLVNYAYTPQNIYIYIYNFVMSKYNRNPKVKHWYLKYLTK